MPPHRAQGRVLRTDTTATSVATAALLTPAAIDGQSPLQQAGGTRLRLYWQDASVLSPACFAQDQAPAAGQCAWQLTTRHPRQVLASKLDVQNDVRRPVQTSADQRFSAQEFLITLLRGSRFHYSMIAPTAPAGCCRFGGSQGPALAPAGLRGPVAMVHSRAGAEPVTPRPALICTSLCLPQY